MGGRNDGEGGDIAEILKKAKPAGIDLSVMGIVEGKKVKIRDLLKYKGKIQKLADEIYDSLKEIIKNDIPKSIQVIIIGKLQDILGYFLKDLLDGKEINEGEVINILTSTLVLTTLFNANHVISSAKSAEIEEIIKKIIIEFINSVKEEKKLEIEAYTFSQELYKKYVENYQYISRIGIDIIISGISLVLNTFISELRKLDKQSPNFENDKENLIGGVLNYFFKTIDFDNDEIYNLIVDEKDPRTSVQDKGELRKEMEATIRRFIEEKI